MSDIQNRTTDVTIFEPNGDKGVNVIDDSGTHRLAVDAKITSVGDTTDVRSLLQKSNDEGDVFIATSNIFIEAGDNEQAIAFIKNPMSSGVKIRIFDIQYSLMDANDVKIRLYKNPTISSNGVAMTISNTNFTSSNTPSAVAYIGASVSSFGTIFMATVIKEIKEKQIEFGGLNMDIILDEGDILLLSADKVKGKDAAVNILFSEKTL